MNVLSITSSFPTSEGTYGASFILELEKSLSSNEISTIILAPHASEGKIRESWGDIQIFRFPYFFPFRFEKLAYGYGMIYNLKKYPVAVLNIPFFLVSELCFSFFIVCTKKIHLIHSHWFIPQGIIGALFRFLFNIPHVATIHGSDLNIMKNNGVLRRLCPFIIKNSDSITVNSSFMKRQLESIVPDSCHKIRIIPMGINPEKYREELSSEFRKKYPAKHIILSVGRLIDWKGTMYLIEAMPEVIRNSPDTILLIVGYGPERESLAGRVHQLGLDLNIIFLGVVENAELPTLYHSADVFVLPSIIVDGKTEGLGVVLLEAMASGCPVIGSNVGGIPDIIMDGENGFLVPEKDPSSLAEKIILLLSNPSIAEQFRHNGQKTVETRFSWDVISQQFSETYMQVLDRQSRKRAI